MEQWSFSTQHHPAQSPHVQLSQLSPPPLPPWVLWLSVSVFWSTYPPLHELEVSHVGWQIQSESAELDGTFDASTYNTQCFLQYKYPHQLNQ